MSSPELPGLVAESQILSRIYMLRDQKIMLDSDLAEMYGVETKQLKRQVKRNAERFPEEFMFILTRKEFEHLRSQIGTSSWNPLYAHGLYGTGCSYARRSSSQENKHSSFSTRKIPQKPLY